MQSLETAFFKKLIVYTFYQPYEYLYFRLQFQQLKH